MSKSLSEKVVRLAATHPPESPLRRALLGLLREGARRRGDPEPTPTTDLKGYMEQLERMMLLPYPAIYDSLGLEKKDVRLGWEVTGNNGHMKVTTQGGTDIDIMVSALTGDHRVEGYVQGQKLQPKTFKFRPAILAWHRGTQGDITSYIEDNYVGTYTYKVCTGGHGCVEYDSLADLTRAHKQTGTQAGGSVRKDLVGQPLLEGLIGPMWDGRKGQVGVVRYEDQSTYDRNFD